MELSRLADLQQLDISGLAIQPYKSFWQSLKGMVGLQKLAIEDTTCLKQLPTRILQQLSSLTSLSLKGCSNLQLLPEPLGKHALHVDLEMDITGCEGLPANAASAFPASAVS